MWSPNQDESRRVRAGIQAREDEVMTTIHLLTETGFWQHIYGALIYWPCVMLGPKDIHITNTDYQGITNLVGEVPFPTHTITDF